jgi:hypothetical protein
MVTLTTAKLIKYFSSIAVDFTIKNRKFSERLKNRHKIFWNDPNAEVVRNTIMDASDPMEKWQDARLWQRKLSNKYNSREFARKHDCRVAKLYWKGRDYHNINFDSFPDFFVIRPTIGHSLNQVFLMKGSFNLMDEKTYSKDDIKLALSKALSANEKLEFLIEEFVRTEAGEYRIPDDYKFYMFNGEIGCIQVINRVNNKEGYTSWYDKDWNLLPNLTTNFPDGARQPRPECFLEMIEFAKKLSESYRIFIRIDLYATDKGAVFGEVTPTPALGIGFTPLADNILTRYWDRFCKEMI